jgi:RimJ/RimL family protein N-acetyltransferase
MPARESRSPRTNSLGQPIGVAVPSWKGALAPTRETLSGRTCRLEALRVAHHADALHAAYVEDREGGNWTYLPYGPFEDLDAYRLWVGSMENREDVIAYAIVDEGSAQPKGVATYLRVDAPNGSIEVGHLSYAPALQRTILSTEAMYLMMRRVFDDLGYRRYEWKCDSLNAPSIAAARRLGFRFEGTFFNQVVVKGRNRDTSWFSILDSEWPALRDAFEAWLDASNFESDGHQRRRLDDLMPEAAGTSRL